LQNEYYRAWMMYYCLMFLRICSIIQLSRLTQGYYIPLKGLQTEIQVLQLSTNKYSQNYPFDPSSEQGWENKFFFCVCVEENCGYMLHIQRRKFLDLNYFRDKKTQNILRIINEKQLQDWRVKLPFLILRLTLHPPSSIIDFF